MKLKPFVTSDRIVIGLKQGTRREILEQLIAPIEDSNCINDSELFLDDLEKREDQVTTVMDNGVAFPHARSTAIDRMCLVVGVAEKDIHFNTSDKIDSRLFFCIGVPARSPTAHMPILQSLANYVKDEKRRDRLIACTLPSQLVKYLANYKG
ncbi:MAG: PTS sugar transporter subunit IIA [Lentisphaeria bacterium]|nr:PTS sugar transporter subunit IIA [Lentisphaeria bacterium]NQZ70586.1 PTS sugar transporter subunit IIA [Lentisphaeria bacterium]